MLDGTASVDVDVARGMPVAALGPLEVIVNERLGYFEIARDAPFDRLLIVVWTLHQRFPGDVVFAFHSRRVELDLVRATRRRMNAAAAHAAQDLRVSHFNFNH